MPAVNLNASLILIGPFSAKFKSLGAEIYPDLHSARNSFETGTCEVLAVSLTAIKESRFNQVWQKILDKQKQTQLILVTPPEYRPKDIIAIHQQFPLFRWRTSFDDQILESDLAQALERSRHLQQEGLLNQLLDQQTQELEHFQHELELRVDKRKKYLVESRRKLFLMNSRMEVFRELLLGLQPITTQTEIEELLNTSLSPWMHIQWIKIMMGREDKRFTSEIGRQLNYEALRVPLYRLDQSVGSIFFMKSKPGTFTNEESEFLYQVGEAVALALERLMKLQELEAFKSEWDLTFQAVSDPVLLINSDYSVIQSNQKKSGRKCFEILFNRSEPCQSCHRGEDFRLQQDGQTFQVTSQKIENSFIHIYHNKSQELRMESQILESARNAELGTIGSSIAHELNNPLGGLLTFLQMIKMDLSPEDPLTSDLVEMEKGAQRCREIIQNLLVFTRAPDLQNETEFNLNELVQQTLRISEIHAKAQQVELEWTPSEVPLCLKGNSALISQALRNFIQIGIDSSKNKKLQIQTTLEDKKIIWSLHIPQKINSKNLKNTNFSWTLAEQIILDQSAEISLLTDQESGTLVKISFSRLVLRS